MIAFTCNWCRQKLKIKDDLAGKKGRCPHCKSTVVYPRGDTATNRGDALGLPPPSRPMTTRPGDAAATRLSQAGDQRWVPLAADEAASGGMVVPGYEVLGELGRGGMGVVYKARQVGLGRVVALKMILAGTHAGASDLARFKTEGEAIARLRHPNIVQVYEVGEHEGLPFFSLEFCDGGSLDKKLAGNPLPPEQAARLVETLARAMQAAHDADVIHRDLKPANVLLQGGPHPPAPSPTEGTGGAGSALTPPRPPWERGLGGEGCFTPKITDFGLAKKLDEAGQTHSGDVLGTPSYMAPEQAAGRSKEIGPLTDVYALGAILYECLTGRPPFKAATLVDTLLQVMREEPVPPRQLNARVPLDLETVCLKCLHKEPLKRYASAGKLADDLTRWQRGEPVLARPVGMIERAVKWARRRPAVAGLLAAIVVLTSLALGVTTALYRDAAAEAERAQKAELVAEEERDNAQEQTRIARKAEKTAREQERIARVENQRAEQQLERAERLLYASQIQAAQREWEAGNVALAWVHLDSCRWDYRGLEHRYLYTLFTWNQVTLEGHTEAVLSVAISPDGKRIVSGSEDRTVKVWDARTGKALLSLEGHTDHVLGVAVSPDGKRVLGQDKKGRILAWDARSGRRVSYAPSRMLGGGINLAVSPDGRRIVRVHQDNTVKVWTGKDILSLEGAAGPAAISSDGRRIVTGSQDRTVKVWDATSGKGILSLRGHTGAVSSVAIAADGKRIISGSWDKTIKVWDGRTGKDLLTLKGHTGYVSSVAVSRDGRRIVSGCQDKTVKVWDATPGKDLSLRGHTNVKTSLAVSSDGTRIVSGRVAWDGQGKPLPAVVQVWDAASGRIVRTIETGGISVAISTDGKRIVFPEDRMVKVQDARTGKDLLSLEGHIAGVSSVTISADGKRIVTGSEDGTMKVWNADTGKEILSLQAHTSNVSSVAISGDGTRLASRSYGGEVKVWNATTGKDLLTLAKHIGLSSLAISPDGNRIISGNLDTVKVQDGRTGKDLLSLKGHIRVVSSVALSADGARIVSGSHDGTVKVWDVTTGKDLLTLKGHLWAVSSVAVSGDGRRIVSASHDGTVKVWDAHTSNDLLSLRGPTNPMRRVALSRDDKQVLGQDEAGRMFAWDARSGYLLPDAPARLLASRHAASADSKLRVSIEDGIIRVRRADLEEARKQRQARQRAILEGLAR
jgi:WD40 repeat protein/serine/threonine protein kinase